MSNIFIKILKRHHFITNITDSSFKLFENNFSFTSIEGNITITNKETQKKFTIKEKINLNLLINKLIETTIDL